jgi:hypothetical protein
MKMQTPKLSFATTRKQSETQPDLTGPQITSIDLAGEISPRLKIMEEEPTCLEKVFLKPL